MHVEPPQILFIKGKNSKKLFRYGVKKKLHMDLTSENSDLYELKMALFDNNNMEEFLDICTELTNDS